MAEAAIKSTPKPATKPRSNFRNIHITQILRYRLPLAGQVSILHRISGALLFLALPTVLLPLFDRSLTSEQSYQAFHSIASMPVVKLVLLVLIWAYLHHFLAGIRYLLLDRHIGIEKAQAANSAMVVLIGGIGLTAVVALKLFGVF